MLFMSRFDKEQWKLKWLRTIGAFEGSCV